MKYYQVDLTPYFNNNAFALEPAAEGGFDSYGNSYPLVERGKINDRVEISGIPFQLGAPDGDNNLVCIEQTIEIPLNEWKAVHFLGSADFANYNEGFLEQFGFKDSDANREKSIPIGFCHWIWHDLDGKYLYGNRPGIIFDYRISAADFEIKSYIWLCQSELNVSANQICLPLNLSMHIFAITLEGF